MILQSAGNHIWKHYGLYCLCKGKYLGAALYAVIALNNLDPSLWQLMHEALVMELITCDERNRFCSSSRKSQSKLDPLFIHFDPSTSNFFFADCEMFSVFLFSLLSSLPCFTLPLLCLHIPKRPSPSHKTHDLNVSHDGKDGKSRTNIV